jgi:hypothetical protein
MVTFVRVIVACLIMMGALVSACDAETIKPKVRLDLRLDSWDVAALHDVIDEFARAEGFMMDNFGPKMPPRDGREFVWLQLSRGGAMRVDLDNFMKADHFFIAFYDLRSDPRFEDSVSKFEEMIDARWPGQLTTYTGK